jgi:hypothetical protein
MVVCLSQISLLRFSMVSTNRLFCVEVIFSVREGEVSVSPVVFGCEVV